MNNPDPNPTITDNLSRIANSLEALVGIQREMMAEIYGIRAVGDDFYEIERVRWLHEMDMAYSGDITRLERALKKDPISPSLPKDKPRPQSI